MRKLIYVFVALSFLAVAGCGGGAGDRKSPPEGKRPGPPPFMNQAERLDKIMAGLTKELELTPQQAVKVRAIIKEGEDAKTKLEPGDEDLKSPEAMDRFFNKLISIDKQTEKKLATVLTNDQIEDYRDYMNDLRRRGLGKKQGGPGGGGPGRGRPSRRGGN